MAMFFLTILTGGFFSGLAPPLESVDWFENLFAALGNKLDVFEANDEFLNLFAVISKPDEYSDTAVLFFLIRPL